MFTELLANPELKDALTTFLAVLAAIAVVPLFKKLKEMATKTKTMADDDFIAAIEKIVNDAVTSKKAKK